MEYYIIDKLELIDGVLVYTPMGYLTSQEDVDATPEITTHFEDWVDSNKTDLENGTVLLSDYFDLYQKSYVCNTISTSVDGMGIDLITDTSVLI